MINTNPVTNDPALAAAAERLRSSYEVRNGRKLTNPFQPKNNPFVCSNGSSGLSSAGVSGPQHISSGSRRGSTSSIGSASSVGSDDGVSNFDKAVAVAKCFFEKSWPLLPVVGLVIATRLICDKVRGLSGPSWEKRFCLSMLGGLGVIALVAVAALCILVISSLFYLLGRGVANMIQQGCAAKQCKTID
ncbi:hypothetical protein [Chlamydia suis]|uniref:hypothetical protein n=1 Tax=Chlamydia suis TaxID=83559 RepID=UPI0009B01D53|nr:hypothetical protein [Chlamydia suis]